MTNLHEINFGLNQYCGPSVLSALTGESTDRCAAVISSISGRKEIRAVDFSHLVKAFEKLRFDCVKVDVNRTLYGTLRSLSEKENAFFIIGVPKHVIAIEVLDHSVYIVDNHSKSPLPAGSSARLMQKVDVAYKVIPKEIPQFIKAEVKLERIGNKIVIYSHSYHKDNKDDFRHDLGYFKFVDGKELDEILYKIHSYYESGEFNEC